MCCEKKIEWNQQQRRARWSNKMCVRVGACAGFPPRLTSENFLCCGWRALRLRLLCPRVQSPQP